jgi:hypothetical protein
MEFAEMASGFSSTFSFLFTIFVGKIPVNAIPFVSDDIGIDRSRYRDKHTPSKKNDIDKACSKWNVSNIAEYFSFDDCVR